jgi:Cu2+-exporting ATPase
MVAMVLTMRRYWVRRMSIAIWWHGVGAGDGGIVLMNNSLRSLPLAVQLARRAQRIMHQNLVWAAAYNLAAVPLAALGMIPPWLAALGMSLSSVLVVLNATRVMQGVASNNNTPANQAASRN